MIKYRLPLLLLSIVALLAAMWAGLLRIGWSWPALHPTLAAAHGPLMVSGFLGTLIAIERAVALQKRWTYLAPLLSGLGGVLLWAGISWNWGNGLLAAGSFGLVLLFGVIVRQHLALYTAVMAAGAVSWLVGNLLLWSGWPIYRVVFWWVAFLVLTIAGERLELSRVLRLTRRVQQHFLVAALIFLGGVLLTLFTYEWGMRVAGLGMVALALWLLEHDIARYNLRKSDLTRFIAVCLFSGYVWLGAGGLLTIWFAGVRAGVAYDAILHTVFLGFVFAMIFGHAPMIFPSVLKRPLPYHPIFYSHLVLLHLSLLLRVAGDLLLWGAGRRWGGLLNVLVLLLFLGNTVAALLRGSRTAAASA